MGRRTVAADVRNGRNRIVGELRCERAAATAVLTWYNPDVRNVALALLLVTASCSAGESPVTTISLGEARYSVPDSHIISASREPHQFVRIKPPDREFELLYDSRTASQSDQFGWPVIFSLNDGRAPNIKRHALGDLVVVCREAVNPKSGCGIRVGHAGAEWTVLFAVGRLNEARVIRQRALAALNAYQG